MKWSLTLRGPEFGRRSQAYKQPGIKDHKCWDKNLLGIRGGAHERQSSVLGVAGVSWSWSGKTAQRENLEMVFERRQGQEQSFSVSSEQMLIEHLQRPTTVSAFMKCTIWPESAVGIKPVFACAVREKGKHRWWGAQSKWDGLHETGLCLLCLPHSTLAQCLASARCSVNEWMHEWITKTNLGLREREQRSGIIRLCFSTWLESRVESWKVREK